MAVSDGQDVNALITNAAFLSRTQNTSAVGILSLENTSAASGASVSNMQASINLGGAVERTLQTLATAAGLNVLPVSGKQLIPIQSSTGELVVNSVPVGATPPVAGIEITLLGVSNANYIKLENSDTNGGIILNGSIELKRFVTITLVYSLSLNRWIERCRNL